MKPTIQYISSIGHRCYSVDFLHKYGLRKCSSPFDHLMIDIESAFQLIQNKFANFLTDIVVIDKSNSSNKIKIGYPQDTNEYNPVFHILLENTFGYMKHNYVQTLINQNFIDKSVSTNLYDWNRICIFHHHNIIDDINIYNQIKNRYERFLYITCKYSDNMALFHITRIVNVTDIEQYIQNIITMKHKYQIPYYLIMIICTDCISSQHFYFEKDRCLFIIKNVENYETQLHKYETENNISHHNYDQEYKIITDHFDFILLEKETIDQERSTQPASV